MNNFQACGVPKSRSPDCCERQYQAGLRVAPLLGALPAKSAGHPNLLASTTATSAPRKAQRPACGVFGDIAPGMPRPMW
jgi:hypothetical protein